MSKTVREVRDELSKLIKAGHGDKDLYHTDALSTPQCFSGPVNIYVGSVFKDEDETCWNDEDTAEYESGEYEEIAGVVVMEAI